MNTSQYEYDVELRCGDTDSRIWGAGRLVAASEKAAISRARNELQLEGHQVKPPTGSRWVARRVSKSPCGCQLCRIEPVGAGSHILPRALFMDVADGDRLFAYPMSAGGHERDARMGPKDHTLMCAKCEQRFQRYDKHAVDVFRTTMKSGGKSLFELPLADAGKLKLFFMHVLWRAANSWLPEFGGVRPEGILRAKRLRECLLRDDPGSPSDFATILVAYDPHHLDKVVAPPRGIVWRPNRARAWQFRFRRWAAVITVSSGGVPLQFSQALLRPGKPALAVAGGSFERSDTFRDALRMAQNNP